MFKLSALADSVPASATLALDAKVKEMRAAGREVISFGIGQPDFPTPAFIQAAATAAMAAGHTGYTPAIGEMALREAVCVKLARENGLRYTPSEVAIGSGGKGILYQLFMALLDPGDEVLLPRPFWLSYPVMIRMAGAVPVLVDCDAETLDLDVADLASKITPRAKLIVLNSPNNPGGNIYSRQTLEQVGALAIEHDLAILSDEVYEHFCYEPGYTSIAAIAPELEQRTIVMNAVSKTYAMTGWRIGYCAVHDEALIKAIARLQGNNQGNPSSVSQRAAIAALTGPQESVGQMREAYLRRRDRMMELLAPIAGLTCRAPAGAFYCFPKLTIDLPDTEVADRLLAEVEVAVVPGSYFGLDGYLRLSYAMADAELERGMARVAAWFAKQGRAE